MKPDSELLNLIAAADSDSPNEAAVKQLEQRLLSDPEARKYYLRNRQLISILESFPPERSEPVRKIALLPFILPAVAVVVVLAGFLYFPRSNSEKSIATLILADDCQWKKSIAEGQRLTPRNLDLKSGTAVIRFDGGAEMVLTGPAGISLQSAASGKLNHGEVVVRAEEGAEGFRLHTPGGEMTDLGTEFAVRVNKKGTTELHVHEGEVASGNQIITAGNAVRIEKKANRETENNAPRFDDVIQKANPKERRDLMQVYEGFHVDAGIYSPEEMDGGKGWKHPWRLRSSFERGSHPADTLGEMIIDHGEMDVVWPVKGGRLGMLKFPAGRNIRIREMAKSIDMGREGITYFSFLAAEADDVVSPEPRNTTNAAPDVRWKRRHDFRLTLRSTDDYYGERISIGWAKDRRPGVQSGPESSVRSIRRLPAGETVFFVGKILRSKHSNDLVYLRFYRSGDRLGFAEPAEWDVETSIDLKAKLDLLLLTAEGETVRYFDEMRIGPTWRSVTPIDHSRSNSGS